MLSYEQLRPMIFKLNPEQAHELTIGLLRLAGSVAPARWGLREWFRPSQPVRPVKAFGLTFRNPIGLAAGYDKDGLAWRGLAELGFGSLELGTVTPQPQPGNPGRRIFRLPNESAAINRMGFPSRGAEFVAKRLSGPRPEGLVIGVNIGKNKTTPLEEAACDYLELLQTFGPLADYLAINVSSPNTPGLRQLQTKSALESLLRPLASERARMVRELGKPLPLLVKLAPDLADDELDDALDAILDSRMDGVIISNTTVRRDGVQSPLAAETGGLSGAPLRARSAQLVRQVYLRTGGRLPIVASGGVMDPDDACRRIDAGATLVQLYTGLIYAGPGLVRQAVEASDRLPQGLPWLPIPQGIPAPSGWTTSQREPMPLFSETP